MSEDASEPYKRRKVSPEDSEQWLEDFQRCNLVARLDSRSQQLKETADLLAATCAHRDALAAQLASIHSAWAKVSPS